MSAKNSYLRYGSVAMALHWIIALLIVVNIVLGITFNEVMGRKDAMRPEVVMFHKSFGLTVLVLSVALLIWRMMNPTPRLPADMGSAWKATARFVHYILYFLMIAVPAMGWALVSSFAKPENPGTMYFGLIAWPNLGFLVNAAPDAKAANGHLFAVLHITFAYCALALAVGHIAAALYHHFVRRDQVMNQMLPGTDVGNDGDTVVGPAT